MWARSPKKSTIITLINLVLVITALSQSCTGLGGEEGEMDVLADLDKHDKLNLNYFDKEPANSLGIYAGWMSIVRGGVSFPQMTHIINTKFLSTTDLIGMIDFCLGENTPRVGKDYLGKQVRTDNCSVTEDSITFLETMEKLENQQEIFDYNITYKQVRVKPFVDNESGQICVLRGGIRKKFFAALKEARFPDGKFSGSDEKAISVIDNIGQQAMNFFDNVMTPELIYQGTQLMGKLDVYKCVLNVLKPGTSVEELKKACQFKCITPKAKNSDVHSHQEL